MNQSHRALCDCRRSVLSQRGIGLQDVIRTAPAIIAWLSLTGLSFLNLFSGIALGDENLRLQDICRLKGQEENTLHGLGMVVGLRGSGDEGSKPTSRSLASTMEKMGIQVARNAQGFPDLDEIKKTGNVAMVFVNVEIPPSGAQQGDSLDCTISAINAKSLEGGTLMLTPLLGPRADQPIVYALAQGQITIPDPRTPTSAVIHRGCKMETTVKNNFINENKITLVLDQDLSSFRTAQYIEDSINEFLQNGIGGSPGNPNTSRSDNSAQAQAMDQLHVEVTIPPHFRQRPVQFVSLLMDLTVTNLQNRKRVVIDEREGVIVIGEDAIISPVAISHKNIVIEAGGPRGSFVEFDSSNPKQPPPRLKNLVDALNALAVPTEDKIAIIKALKRKGDLYAELVVQ